MKRTTGWIGASMAVALVLAPAGGTAQAADPAIPENLAKLIPPSVVTVVRGTDLGRLWDQAKTSTFAGRLQATKAWLNYTASEDYAKIIRARDELQRLYGFDLGQALKDTLGREVILVEALEQMPDGSHRRYFHVLLARATSGERLKAVADQIRAMRTQTEELKSSVKHTHRGQVIYEEVHLRKRGQRAGREKHTFYCLVGELLIAGERLGPVKAVVDRLLDPSKPSLADSPRYRRALASLPEGRPITAYIDAAALAGKAKVAERFAERRKNRALRRLIGGLGGLSESLDTVAVAAEIDADLRVQYRVKIDPEKLDPAALALLQPRAAPHAAWGVLPENTVLATTTRTDVAKLMAFVRSRLLMPKAGVQFDRVKQALSAPFAGRDFEKEVLPQFGPELAVVVTRHPLAAGVPAGTKLGGLAASLMVQVSGEGDVSERLMAGLGVLSWLAVNGNNRNPAKPELVRATERVGDVAVTYIDFAGDHALKGTLSPCFARVGSFVVVSTSRAAMRDLIEASAGVSTLAATPAFKRHLGRFNGEADRLCYLNTRQLAAAVRDNLVLLTARQVKKRGKTEEKARADLEALSEILDLLDGLSLARTVSPDGIVATMTVTAAPAESP